MDMELQAQMLTERCQMYLRHLRGVVYLLNFEAQKIEPGVLPPEWPNLMNQIVHLAESTEREVLHFGKNFESVMTSSDVEDEDEQTRAA